jgi:transposase
MTTVLVLLMQSSPLDFGYQRSRWSTELLAINISRLMELNMAASTLRRWLPRMGIVWRRPMPALRIKDPAYQEKMAKINLPAVLLGFPVVSDGHRSSHYG